MEKNSGIIITAIILLSITFLISDLYPSSNLITGQPFVDEADPDLYLEDPNEHLNNYGEGDRGHIPSEPTTFIVLEEINDYGRGTGLAHLSIDTDSRAESLELKGSINRKEHTSPFEIEFFLPLGRHHMTIITEWPGSMPGPGTGQDIISPRSVKHLTIEVIKNPDAINNQPTQPPTTTTPGIPSREPRDEPTTIQEGGGFGADFLIWLTQIFNPAPPPLDPNVQEPLEREEPLPEPEPETESRGRSLERQHRGLPEEPQAYEGSTSLNDNLAFSLGHLNPRDSIITYPNYALMMSINPQDYDETDLVLFNSLNPNIRET